MHSRVRKEGIREREEREEFSHRFLLLDASPFLALPVPKTTSYFLQQARRERKKVLYRSERKCGGAEIPPSWYTICRSELTARGRGGFANVIKPTLANLADGIKRDFFFFAMVHNELFLATVKPPPFLHPALYRRTCLSFSAPPLASNAIREEIHLGNFQQQRFSPSSLGWDRERD